MFQILARQSRVIKKPSQSLRRLAITVLPLALVACAGEEFGEAPSLSTGVFLDSAVSGLGYATASVSSQTDTSGEFEFDAGEQIVFSIGGYALPETQASAFVTPLSLFGADSVDDPRVQDLSRLLQSLDADGDPSNGITLPANVQSIESDTQIDFGMASFDSQATVVLQQVNGPDAQLIDANTATAHLTQTLVDNNLIAAGCSSEHPFVGRTAELSTRAHGVSGTIRVVDDCTIEVTEFNYDGGGPAVFFYAAIGRNYASDSFPIGPRLNGRQWVNESLLLPIPDGMTLDDFDSLSVWCFDFNANFGDAFFGDT